MFCVPPPRPSDPTNISVPNQGMEWDGPLLLNALLVVAERYSALKRARFGSETSAEALRGMRVLLCFARGPGGEEKGSADVGQGVPGSVDVERVGQGEEVGGTTTTHLESIFFADPTIPQRLLRFMVSPGLCGWEVTEESRSHRPDQRQKRRTRTVRLFGFKFVHNMVVSPLAVMFACACGSWL